MERRHRFLEPGDNFVLRFNSDVNLPSEGIVGVVARFLSKTLVLDLRGRFADILWNFSRQSRGCADARRGSSAILLVVYLPRKAGNKH